PLSPITYAVIMGRGARCCGMRLSHHPSNLSQSLSVNHFIAVITLQSFLCPSAHALTWHSYEQQERKVSIKKSHLQHRITCLSAIESIFAFAAYLQVKTATDIASLH